MITSYANILTNWWEDNNKHNYLHLNADNTFSFKCIVDGPSIQYLRFGASLIPILLIPGDHVTVNVSHLLEYNQKVEYTGRCAEYSRVLENMPAIKFNYGVGIMTGNYPNFTMSEINNIARKYKEFYEYFIAKYQLSEEEANIVKAETTLYPATLCLSNGNTKDLSLLKDIPLGNVETYCASMNERFTYKLGKFVDKIQDSTRYSSIEKVMGTDANGVNYYIENDKYSKIIDDGFGIYSWSATKDYMKEIREDFMQLKSPYFRTLALKIMSNMSKPAINSYRLPNTPAGKAIKKITEQYKGKYLLVKFLYPEDTKAINVFDSIYNKYKDTIDFKVLAVFNEVKCSKAQFDSLRTSHTALADAIYLDKDDWYLIRDQYLDSNKIVMFDKRGFRFKTGGFSNTLSQFDYEWQLLKSQEHILIPCIDETRIVFY